MTTKEEVRQYIENGGKCYYRYGFAWKGKGKREISKEKALEYLKTFTFGMGFYEICIEDNEVVFNEYSASDME